MEDELTNQNIIVDYGQIDFNLSSLDLIRNGITLFFIIAGVIADILTISVIALNSRLRNKTNIILMNFIINDAIVLINQIRFVPVVIQSTGVHHLSQGLACAFHFINVGFQINQALFLLLLLSNTIMKREKIQTAWLITIVYALMIIIFILNQQFCEYREWSVLFALGNILFLCNIIMVILKEVNNCYKKWYKKDPLSWNSIFRLTIGRIYIICFVVSYIALEVSRNFVTSIILYHYLMTSVYILIYIIYADEKFKKCFLMLMKCKSGDFNEEARNEDDVNFEDAGKRMRQYE